MRDCKGHDWLRWCWRGNHRQDFDGMDLPWLCTMFDLVEAGFIFIPFSGEVEDV